MISRSQESLRTLRDLDPWQEIASEEAVRAIYLAGGGDAAQFEPLWELQLERARVFKANVQAQGAWTT